jgi:hypothetical protein
MHRRGNVYRSEIGRKAQLQRECKGLLDRWTIGFTTPCALHPLCFAQRQSSTCNPTARPYLQPSILPRTRRAAFEVALGSVTCSALRGGSFEGLKVRMHSPCIPVLVIWNEWIGAVFQQQFHAPKLAEPDSPYQGCLSGELSVRYSSVNVHVSF